MRKYLPILLLLLLTLSLPAAQAADLPTTDILTLPETMTYSAEQGLTEYLVTWAKQPDAKGYSMAVYGRIVTNGIEYWEIFSGGYIATESLTTPDGKPYALNLPMDSITLPGDATEVNLAPYLTRIGLLGGGYLQSIQLLMVMETTDGNFLTQDITLPAPLPIPYYMDEQPVKTALDTLVESSGYIYGMPEAGTWQHMLFDWRLRLESETPVEKAAASANDTDKLVTLAIMVNDETSYDDEAVKALAMHMLSQINTMADSRLTEDSVSPSEKKTGMLSDTFDIRLIITAKSYESFPMNWRLDQIIPKGSDLNAITFDLRAAE